MGNRRERHRRAIADIFLFLLAGLVALASAGCSQESKPVTAETTKFRPADDAAPVGGGDAAGATPFPSPSGNAGAGADAAPAGDLGTPASIANKAPAGDVSGNAKSAASAKAPAAGGDMQQLLLQMDRLSQQPKGKTQQEQLEDFVRNQQQRLAIGAKVLGMNPEKQVKQRVVQAMYEVHRFFVDQLRAPGAREQLAAFSKSLVTDADPDLQRMGRHTQFEANVSRIANEQAGDGKERRCSAARALHAAALPARRAVPRPPERCGARSGPAPRG